MGDSVVGIDNLNDYYDVTLKKARLAILENYSNFTFYKMDIANRDAMENLFAYRRPDKPDKYTPLNSKTIQLGPESPSPIAESQEPQMFDIIVHLAAQAGVRYSIENPYAYVNSNLVGFVNIIEGCRHGKVKHLVFASSSSVYGANTKMPFSVHDNVDHPVSLYAATKKANELMAHTYASLYNIPCTGLRFFTVYGPWGRPDMAYFLFAKAILDGGAINVFNYGKMKRDFTYIDDIVEGVIRVMNRIPEADDKWDGNNPDPGTSFVPYKIYNIGNNNPLDLMEFIKTLEDCLGKKIEKNYLPLQAGDVPVTYADVYDLIKDVQYKPNTPIKEGIKRFVKWYREYYSVLDH